MRTLFFFILLTCLSSCAKFDWHNPYDPECPKELFTPSSPGASMEGNSVKLTWSQQNEDISGFALFRSAEGESISDLTQTQKSTTQYIDANFTPGKKYTYYVVAVAGTNKSDTVKAEITPVIPVTISTGAVTELSATSAKVEGNVTNTGGGTVTSRGVCWSTTPSPTVNNSKTTEGTGAGVFTSTLTNLLAGTTYYARAYGENSRGVSYGTQVTFTTLGPPKITTTAVSNITATTATSGGTIISDGGSPITAKGVVWSTSPNPTIALVTKTDDGTGLGSFTSELSNLTINTKYYVRAYATNIIGTTYGAEVSFNTRIPVPPILESLSQGLVAYYPFSGNAGDSSGNGNHGTVNGATLTSDRFGATNKAYLFDGVNDFVQISSSQFLNMSSGQDFSVAFFVDIKNFSSKPFDGLVSKMFPSSGSLGANNGWQIGLTNTTIRVQSRAGSSSNAFNNQACASDIIDNVSGSNKYHFAFAFDRKNGELRFFKNGISVSSLVCPELNGDFSNNYPLLIGVDRENAFYFNGVIDEIRIYNRLITQEEITYLANN